MAKAGKTATTDKQPGPDTNERRGFSPHHGQGASSEGAAEENEEGRPNVSGIEDIEYRGGAIKVRRSGQWKAIVYAPGATICEVSCPTGEDRDSVIAEAKRVMDARITELSQVLSGT